MGQKQTSRCVIHFCIYLNKMEGNLIQGELCFAVRLGFKVQINYLRAACPSRAIYKTSLNIDSFGSTMEILRDIPTSASMFCGLELINVESLALHGLCARQTRSLSIIHSSNCGGAVADPSCKARRHKVRLTPCSHGMLKSPA